MDRAQFPRDLVLVSIVSIELISHLFLVFLLLTLNRLMFAWFKGAGNFMCLCRLKLKQLFPAITLMEVSIRGCSTWSCLKISKSTTVVVIWESRNLRTVEIFIQLCAIFRNFRKSYNSRRLLFGICFPR